MNLIEKSLEIAIKAYRGKKDKAGKTYILHPLRIMSKMETEEQMAVALLHDVIEDSNYTAIDLLDAGISKRVVDAVICLTKNEGETYKDFIERILPNNLADRVKKADIEDNINLLRLKSVTDKDLKRIAKYHRAWIRLENN